MTTRICQYCQEYLERYEDLKVVGIANDGLQTAQMLRKLNGFTVIGHDHAQA